MKISSTYRSFGEPIPNAELLFQTSLDYLLDPDRNENILWIRNPLNTLVNVQAQMPSAMVDENTLIDVIRSVTKKLKKYANPEWKLFTNTRKKSLRVPSQGRRKRGLVSSHWDCRKKAA